MTLSSGLGWKEPEGIFITFSPWPLRDPYEPLGGRLLSRQIDVETEGGHTAGLEGSLIPQSHRGVEHAVSSYPAFTALAAHLVPFVGSKMGEAAGQLSEDV